MSKCHPTINAIYQIHPNSESGWWHKIEVRLPSKMTRAKYMQRKFLGRFGRFETMPNHLTLSTFSVNIFWNAEMG